MCRPACPTSPSLWQRKDSCRSQLLSKCRCSRTQLWDQRPLLWSRRRRGVRPWHNLGGEWIVMSITKRFFFAFLPHFPQKCTFKTKNNLEQLWIHCCLSQLLQCFDPSCVWECIEALLIAKVKQQSALAMQQMQRWHWQQELWTKDVCPKQWTVSSAKHCLTFFESTTIGNTNNVGYITLIKNVFDDQLSFFGNWPFVTLLSHGWADGFCHSVPAKCSCSVSDTNMHRWNSLAHPAHSTPTSESTLLDEKQGNVSGQPSPA